jgi:hypothetical protein
VHMSKFAVATAALFLVSSAPALAGDSGTPGTATVSNASSTTTTKGQDKPDLDVIVCHSYPPPTGTRIGARRICKPEREWEQIQQNEASALTKMQVQHSLSPSGN